MPTIPALPMRRYPLPRRRSRSLMLGSFGLVPFIDRGQTQGPGTFPVTMNVHPLPPIGARPCPQIIEWIPPGCTAQIVTDANGCTTRVPICPPSSAPSPTPAPTPAPLGPPTPAPITTPQQAGCLTNQVCVLPDGSQWIYSTQQGQWISMGVPFNVGAPPVISAPPAITTVPAPAPVVVTPPAGVPAPSPYQSIIDFATQDTLISGVPNWIVGLGAFAGYKILSARFAGRGR